MSGPFNPVVTRSGVSLFAALCLGLCAPALVSAHSGATGSGASTGVLSMSGLQRLVDISYDLWPLTSERELRERRAATRRAIEAARNEVRAAHDSTMARTVAWQSLPAQPAIQQLLDQGIPEDESVSTGDPSDGELHNAVELPVEGAHYTVIEEHRDRETNYGTQEVIALLKHAAAEVAEQHAGSELRVGNISRKSGGDIRWSGSHNSGRDADVAFFAESTQTGRDVVTPDLVAFGRFGESRSGRLKFDVARNWSLVRAMLTFDGAELQWLFISQPLKAKLLARAHRIGEPASLIRRARKVLHQPTAAPPHGDHFHIRIACPPDDRLLGCQEYGPQWSWHDTHRHKLLARTLALIDALPSVDRQSRETIWTRLSDLGSPYSTEVALRRALRLVREDAGDHSFDATNISRVERAVTFAQRHGEVSTTALVLAEKLLDRSPASMPSRIRRGLYGVLRRGLLYDSAPGPDRPTLAQRQLIGQLTDRSLPRKERTLAARSLASRPQPDLIPVLIDQLRRQPTDVRTAIFDTLQLWAGRSADTEHTGDAHELRIQDWRNWYSRSHSRPRETWIDNAFTRHGYPEANKSSLSAGDTLLDVLKTSDRPDWLRQLAARRLEDLTERHLPFSWGLDRQTTYWSNWWPGNRARLFGEETARELTSALPEAEPPTPRTVAVTE